MGFFGKSINSMWSSSIQQFNGAILWQGEAIVDELASTLHVYHLRMCKHIQHTGLYAYASATICPSIFIYKTVDKHKSQARLI